MPDTGYLCPSANTAGTGGFANPDSAYDDCIESNIYANETTNDHSHIYYNHGFSIPAGATINGMEVGVFGYMDATISINGDTINVEVEISINGGSTYSTAKVGTFIFDIPGINQGQTLGSSTDLWGLSPTDTSFTDANLRVRYKVTNLSAPIETMYIDLVRMRVHYTGGSVVITPTLLFLGVG